MCRVIEDGIPNNCSRFLSPPAKLFVFGLPGCLLAGVHVGRSRGKGNAFCESVSRKLFVFLSEIKKKKNCAENLIQPLIWIKLDTLVSSE